MQKNIVRDDVRKLHIFSGGSRRTPPNGLQAAAVRALERPWEILPRKTHSILMHIA